MKKIQHIKKSKFNFQTKLFSLTLLIFFSIIQLAAQKVDWQPMQREITVKYNDSVVKAHVLLQKTKIEVSNDRTYYWYGQNSIFQNTGGYSGQLLHGEYAAYNMDGSMITKGNFNKGLKVGTWKAWDSKGKLKSTQEFKDGLAHGKLTCYDNSGDVVSVKNYRNGNLLIEKEEDEKRFSFFERFKKTKNDTIPIDTISKPKDTFRK